MGTNSGIEWTHHTFNGWIGCEHAELEGHTDPMCEHCYAEVGTMARIHRHRGLPIWGHDAPRHRTSVEYWKHLERWNRSAGERGVRERVFAHSLSDLFEDRRDLDPWRAEEFAIIERCTNLDFLLLTKRPDKMVELAPASWRKGWPRHVAAGTSVGTQAAADVRVAQLLEVPASMRFLSCEPLLERVVLTHLPVPERIDGGRGFRFNALTSSDTEHFYNDHPAIDWVIVGGESGDKARPINVEWARSLRDQCSRFGVAFFFKQWGEFCPPNQLPPAAFVDWDAVNNASGNPDIDRPLRFGKKRSGALLDGVLHRAMPEVLDAA